MLACRMAHDLPHNDIATEWFGLGQTIAMLPLNRTETEPCVSSLVLTLSACETERLPAAGPETFAAEIERRHEGRLGAMRLLSTRHCYPLVAVYASRFVSGRLALVGDAAVGMHPVTAHGFNFGLLGADTAAASVGEAAASGGDIGASSVLGRYESRHRRATLPLFLSTNAIARLYTDDRFPARVLRDAAIRAGSCLAPMRRAVVGRLMAGAGGEERRNEGW